MWDKLFLGNGYLETRRGASVQSGEYCLWVKIFVVLVFGVYGIVVSAFIKIVLSALCFLFGIGYCVYRLLWLWGSGLAKSYRGVLCLGCGSIL